jgi:uncharacterized protein YbjQ (UPF0145 family)
MELLFKFGLFLILITVGYWRGRYNERQHLRLLDAEEDAVADILIFATRYPPPSEQPLDPILVSGSAVIGSDYFRLFMSGLRKIVGGNYRAYEQLLERGRRQALVRLKQAAKARGATMIFNVRLTTSRISNSRGGEATQVEVLAYGTAFVPASGRVADSRVHYLPGQPLLSSVPEQEAFKHRFSRRWLIGWFVLVFYVFFEAMADRYMELQWRYALGAPWIIYLVLSILLTGWLCWRAIRAKTVASTYVVMGLLTVLVLMLTLYFGVLRLNALLSSSPESIRYTVQTDGLLKPPDPSLPTLRLEYYSADGQKEYWSQLPTGQTVEISLLQGLLGVYQYDLKPLSARYEQFYRSGR